MIHRRSKFKDYGFMPFFRKPLANYISLRKSLCSLIILTACILFTNKCTKTYRLGWFPQYNCPPHCVVCWKYQSTAHGWCVTAKGELY